MTLRDRCKEWLQDHAGMVNGARKFDHLTAFVEQEIGRCPACDGSGNDYERIADKGWIIGNTVAACVKCNGTGKRQRG